jgi:hypothetical protein
MLKDIERAFFEHKTRRDYPAAFPLSFWFAGRRIGSETLRGFSVETTGICKISLRKEYWHPVCNKEK